MNVRVLGCHGSDQLVAWKNGAHSCGTCGFLINDTLLVDAGTVGSRLTLAEQKRIRHVLLSHAHFDHVKGLPTLADNLVGDPAEPIVVAGIPDVLKGIKAHIFNDEIYPDFFRLPDPTRPVFVEHALEAGRESVFSGHRVLPIGVNHLVPTVGFLIAEQNTSILYSGDTYHTERLWQVAARWPTLKAALIEASFPNEMADLAQVSKHLTPKLLAEEYRKIGRPDLPVYAYHLKPRFRERIIEQLHDLHIPNLVVLEEGQILAV
ncbi:MAG: MBL fold metallo-hydrolase [Nitrospiraceae bacterium]